MQYLSDSFKSDQFPNHTLIIIANEVKALLENIGLLEQIHQHLLISLYQIQVPGKDCLSCIDMIDWNLSSWY